MASTQKQLPLDEVLVGMVLSEQICNAFGTVLLAQGTVITEAILHSLQKHKIESLPILFEVGNQQDLQAELDERLKRLQYLFRKHPLHDRHEPPNDANALLFDLLQTYRRQQSA